ncbi:serine/threonine-protein kinase [Actinomadura chibensis]|uniref:serine/threonine-protein kinase n=1 Tax=Actinomadura chibensis TaxID=392828 RepID=UPI0020D03FAC|nr:serine/threonine-protein kinase [Actinomadura chibensis]
MGRYRLSGRLGAGGMGEVFFGLTPGGRPVAVKLIHQVHAANPEFRRRFQSEIEAARKVNGLHTAGVVDADPAADPPWMVTAFIPGPSLERALAEHGPFPDATLRVLGAGIAEALEAIHEAGLIHRDLKPSNILLGADGPRVIDFGIARATDASQATAMAGTPGFMSPEILTGESLTPAADIFAFGLVLAHAAGVRPFGEGPQPALSYRIVHQEPSLAGLEHGLGEIIGRCLAKSPAERPTPAQLLQELAPPMLGGSWLPAPVQTMIDQQVSVLPSAPLRNSADAVPGGSGLGSPAPAVLGRVADVGSPNPVQVGPRNFPPARPQKPVPGNNPQKARGVAGSPVAQRPRSGGIQGREWQFRVLSLLAIVVLVPSLAMLVIGAAEGAQGGCSLFAARANAAEAGRPTAPGLAACDESNSTAEILLGVIGLGIGVSLAIGARNRRQP